MHALLIWVWQLYIDLMLAFPGLHACSVIVVLGFQFHLIKSSFLQRYFNLCVLARSTGWSSSREENHHSSKILY